MLTARDVDRFCGIPYCARAMDCADLFVHVQHELFGRGAELAGARPRPASRHAQARQLAAYVDLLAHRVEQPRDGDAVLMVDFGQSAPGHIGTFFFLAHESWVLHTTEALGASVLHRLRDLPSYGLRVEGFYRWI